MSDCPGMPDCTGHWTRSVSSPSLKLSWVQRKEAAVGRGGWERVDGRRKEAGGLQPLQSVLKANSASHPRSPGRHPSLARPPPRKPLACNGIRHLLLLMEAPHAWVSTGHLKASDETNSESDL
eukprot:3911246-Rhodomonas_salina.2